MPVGVNAFVLPRMSQLNPMLPALLWIRDGDPSNLQKGGTISIGSGHAPSLLPFRMVTVVFRRGPQVPHAGASCIYVSTPHSTCSFICSSHAHSGAPSCLQSSDYSSHSFIHLLNIVQTTAESRCFRQYIWPPRALRLGCRA